MGLFDQFPYTNLHELNLDWILEALKEIQTTTEQFVAINSLKYADPIQWNITSQYEKNTIVIDPQSGTAYISVQAVPTGVTLTNTDYWTVVFDLEQFVTKANNNFTPRVEESTTLNATFATNIGQWVIWGGELYEALSNIIAGDQYVPNSNIKRITVEEITGDLIDLDTTNKDNLVLAINEVLSHALAEIATEAAARQNADTTLQTNIDAEAAARQSADTTLQNNIDAEATARQSADTTLQNNIDAETTARQTADATLQNNIDAETTARQTADAAINDRIDNIVSEINNDKIIFIGDSYGLDSEIPDGTSWVTKIQPYFTEAEYLITGGTSFASDLSGVPNWQTQLATYVSTLTTDQRKKVSQVIVIGGANDGNLIFGGTLTTAVLKDRIAAFTNYVKTYLPNATVKCAFVGWYRIYNRHEAYLDAARTYSLHIADNYSYFAAGENIMRCINFIETTLSIHPTDAASGYLASFVCSVANNGDWKFQYKTLSQLTVSQGMTVDSLGQMAVDYNGDMCTIDIIGTYYNAFFRVILANQTAIPTGEIVNIGVSSGTPIGVIKILTDTSSTSIIGEQVMIKVYDTAGTATDIPAIIGIYQGALCLKFLGVTGLNVKTILIPNCQINLNLNET